MTKATTEGESARRLTGVASPLVRVGILAALVAGCGLVTSPPPAPHAAGLETPSGAVDLIDIGEPMPVFRAESSYEPRTAGGPPAAAPIRVPALSSRAGLAVGPLRQNELEPAARPHFSSHTSTTALPTAEAPDDAPVDARASAAGLDASADELFRSSLDELRALMKRVDTGAGLGSFDRLRRAELEKRLIALFFLRERRDHLEYRELVDSMAHARSPVLALELLKAAWFEELGLAEQRDGVLDGVARRTGGRRGPPGFAIRRCNVAAASPAARHTLSAGEARRFAAGQELLISGELAHFENTTISAFGGISNTYRRSFSAAASLYDVRGELVARGPILLAGQATEVTTEAREAVEFWGRHTLPAGLASGPYMLELTAVDLEGKQAASSHLEITVR